MKPEDFIEQYSDALKTQDWKIVESLIHNDASVTFSNGVVHIGKPKIKIAFEKNFSVIKNEVYLISKVKWLLKNESTAVYLFDFYWKGIVNNKQAAGNGIGTVVLIKESGKWKLLTEHLGKKFS